MKKRLMAIALATLAVFSLAGCKSMNKTNAKELADYSAYVTVGDYTNFKLEVEKVEVTEEKVQNNIQNILESSATYEQITNRVVGEKDTINLDFTGYNLKDDGTKGEAFSGGSSKDYSYTIGGTFIKDLNDQLIGLECGKEVDLTCTFPDDYSTNKDLAGVTVIFTVKVNYIQGEKVLPEWNDEFVKEYTASEDKSFDNVADFESYIRKTLQENAESEMKSNYQALIWAKIIENSEIKSYPEEAYKDLYDKYYEQVYYYIKNYASYFGMEPADFLTSYGEMFFGVKDDDGIKGMAETYAKQELDSVMLAIEISKKEGIIVTTSEYESLAADIVEEYGYTSLSNLESTVGENYLMETFIYDKVTEWLESHNEQVLVDPVEETTGETAAETDAETDAK